MNKQTGYVNISASYYTPQDNRADFGPISPLPTILGYVPIILVVLKIILSDFPVVWGVLRVTESERKNVGGGPIANHKNIFNMNIYDQKSCCVGEPRGQTHVWSADYHVKQNNIQSESELTEDGSITNCNKNMSWRSTKGFGHCHRNYFLPLPKTGMLPLL